MLYAGSTWLFSFKYLILNNYVKKLKLYIIFLKEYCIRSISAGNPLESNTQKETSETLRDETVIKSENIPFVSEHLPKYKKPLTDYQFGHYLAGLIDGNGHFSSKQELIIEFHELNCSLAYYIKKRIGFGRVKKVQPKNVVHLIITNRKGMKKVISLINEKIRTQSKYNQIENNILKDENYIEFSKTLNFKLNIDQGRDALKNHWLVGFSDAGNSSFQIEISKSDRSVEIILNFNIYEKGKYLLELIQEYLGGELGHCKNKDSYCYNYTTSSAGLVIDYFDHFNLLSNRQHINYLKWRKLYLKLQDVVSISYDDLYKILKLKYTIKDLRDITVKRKSKQE